MDPKGKLYEVSIDFTRIFKKFFKKFRIFSYSNREYSVRNTAFFSELESIGPICQKFQIYSE